MENKQSAAGTQDNSMMKSIDQRARSKGRSDIMTRRLKNRERQRRYRARKRLEAETKKSFVVEETTAVLPVQAHVANHQEMAGSIASSPYVPEVTCLALGNKSETMLEREILSGSSSILNNETPRIVLGRRDWKAEARRKRN
ncbi:hypothetical protein SESBI_33186 [Sesbania bispinosa]|nr:hypothetical protein SESBI_33186 [Sesbania bispinosa]